MPENTYLHTMIGDQRDTGFMIKSNRFGTQSTHRFGLAAAVFIGLFLGCAFAFTFPSRFFASPSPVQYTVANSNAQFTASSCESSEQFGLLKSENKEQKDQIRELTEKLRLVEKGTDNMQKKPGPFGTVMGLRTNPTIIPDESVNPTLSKLLEKLAVNRELIVALANANAKDKLEVWFTSIKRVSISNYLVYALDEETSYFCQLNNVPVYKQDFSVVYGGNFEAIARTGLGHQISALKFLILRQFLQLGYSILLSDIDIIYLQNPFDHLYRDSDVESMSDGFNNDTVYGYKDAFYDPAMGWSSYAYTTRIFVFNSGFFYIRPTLPSIELLDRVAGKLSRESSWDQLVFNEELFFPSHPGYEGLHASKRAMDYYKFMNSKVLFKIFRKDAGLMSTVKPVVIHVNYHPDKIVRMKAVVDYFVNGKGNALDPFPDGTNM